MNDPSRLGIEAWDRTYAVEGPPQLWGDPVPFVAEMARHRLAPTQSGLEVPCGDGRNTVSLAQHVNSLVAVDSSDLALERAAERVRGERVQNVKFLNGNIYGLPFGGSDFDFVVCWDLLAHLEKPVGALEELARVCAPGGSIVVNFYSRDDSTRGENMVELRPNEFIYDGRFYYRYYSDQDVVDLVSRLRSLAIAEFETVRWSEPPHKGYREYAHEHESWCLVLRKISDTAKAT